MCGVFAGVGGDWIGVQCSGNRGGLYGEGGTRSCLSPRRQVCGCADSSALPEGKHIIVFSPFALGDSTRQELRQLRRAQASLFRGLLGSTASPQSPPVGRAPRVPTAGGERASDPPRGAAGQDGIRHTRLNPCPQATFLRSPPCRPSPSPFT